MQRKRAKRRRLVFAAAFGGLILSLALSWYVYPYFSFEERFKRSKPALEAFAAQVAEDAPSVLAKPPKRLGYFDLLNTEPLPHGFLFQSDYGNPFDWLGIAYSTEPLPRNQGLNYYKHIEGNWYEVFRE